jgi:hypothetical protein
MYIRVSTRGGEIDSTERFEMINAGTASGPYCNTWTAASRIMSWSRHGLVSMQRRQGQHAPRNEVGMERQMPGTCRKEIPADCRVRVLSAEFHSVPF